MSSEGCWEFYTRIAEMCDTARRHSKDYQTQCLPPELHNSPIVLSYFLRQAENKARELAGERSNAGKTEIG